MTNNNPDPDCSILWHAIIDNPSRSTGNTIHRNGDKELAVPSLLQIAQYKGDAGFYLFYLDEYGEELTDTYHDSVLGAMEQAEFEFTLFRSEWKKSSGPDD